MSTGLPRAIVQDAEIARAKIICHPRYAENVGMGRLVRTANEHRHYVCNRRVGSRDRLVWVPFK